MILNSANKTAIPKLFEAIRPMHRTAFAQLLEQLVRRSVLPQLPRGEFHALQIAPNSCHEDLRDRSAPVPADDTGWPARAADFGRRSLL